MVNLTGGTVSSENTEGQYGFGQLIDSLMTSDWRNLRAFYRWSQRKRLRVQVLEELKARLGRAGLLFEV